MASLRKENMEALEQKLIITRKVQIFLNKKLWNAPPPPPPGPIHKMTNKRKHVFSNAVYHLCIIVYQCIIW
jgi:hypothetical protein